MDKQTALQLLAVLVAGSIILIIALCVVIFSPAIVINSLEWLQRKKLKKNGSIEQNNYL